MENQGIIRPGPNPNPHPEADPDANPTPLRWIKSCDQRPQILFSVPSLATVDGLPRLSPPIIPPPPPLSRPPPLRPSPARRRLSFDPRGLPTERLQHRRRRDLLHSRETPGPATGAARSGGEVVGGPPGLSPVEG